MTSLGAAKLFTDTATTDSTDGPGPFDTHPGPVSMKITSEPSPDEPENA